MGARVVHGDALAEVARLPDACVDAIVTDPPYEIGFMGARWDRTRIAYSVPLWRDCRRVLRPGGWLLAFGGTRTAHRLACAVEDAGFELRDTVTWLYGSGFPKGKGCLKPASEPIVVGRRPAPAPWLNIDACRVGTDGGGTSCSNRDETGKCYGHCNAGRSTSGETFHGPDTSGGRWPANVVLSHAPECVDLSTGAGSVVKVRIRAASTDLGGMNDDAWRPREVEQRRYDDTGGGTAGCVPGCPVAELDAQSGATRSSAAVGVRRHGRSAGIMGNVGELRDGRPEGHNDSGGASRFFPAFRYQAKAPARERPKVNGIAHPTVKPLALTRWLVRLVTPPGGTVLDPFAGSGTTGEACLEGLSAVLIQSDARYLPHIALRLRRAV